MDDGDRLRGARKSKLARARSCPRVFLCGSMRLPLPHETSSISLYPSSLERQHLHDRYQYWETACQSVRRFWTSRRKNHIPTIWFLILFAPKACRLSSDIARALLDISFMLPTHQAVVCVVSTYAGSTFLELFMTAISTSARRFPLLK